VIEGDPSLAALLSLFHFLRARDNHVLFGVLIEVISFAAFLLIGPEPLKRLGNWMKRKKVLMLIVSL
jgi:hypothetical protein